MSAALAALAARAVGRRVRLHNGTTGTITRVTRHGYVIAVDRVTHDEIDAYLDE